MWVAWAFAVPIGLIVFVLHLASPINREVTGAPKMTSQPVSPIFWFSTALWDLANSRPVHFQRLFSHLFFSLPCLLPPFTCLARWFWPDLMNGRHVRYVSCSLRLFTMVRRSSCGQITDQVLRIVSPASYCCRVMLVWVLAWLQEIFEPRNTIYSL